MKIYHCSNKKEGSDIIASLIENSRIFRHRFVIKASLSDVIITVDGFTDEIKELKIPKIKIMDSMVCQDDLSMNNQDQLDAIELADYVIFTSKSIKEHLLKLYPNIKIKKSTIIRRITDSKIFKTIERTIPDIEYLIAVADDWSQPEARLQTLLDFMSIIPQKLYLVGKCNEDVPENIIKIKNFDNISLNKLLSESHVMIDISYKNFSSKYVSMAIAAGLPVIYTNSGCLEEVVQFGSSMEDDKEIKFYTQIPEIDKMMVMNSFNDVRTNFKTLYKQDKKNILLMVTNYYNILSEFEKE
jgi:glycosyltransferase involved in cell wall biosynthesis